MGRKKKKEILENVKIEKIAAKGKALARVDGIVVFVTGAVPGDVVDILVTKKRKSYKEGIILKFHEYSKDRTEPKCKHFGVCGGCKWQFLPYDKQLEYKRNEVVEAFEHIAGVTPETVEDIVPSQKIFHYRNKLEYTFSNRRWFEQKLEEGEQPGDRDALGFHVPRLFDRVVDIEECWLQPEPSNAIRNFVRRVAKENNYSFYDIREHKGYLRNLVVRNNRDGDFMVILIVAEEREDTAFILDDISVNFPQVKSLYYIVNTKKNDSYADLEPVLYKGEPYLNEKIGNLKFRIHPKSFFQTNADQGERLYEIAKEFAQLTGDEIVYDLYTGTGTIALFVADKAKKVVGIEYIPEAIEDAKENAAMNGIENAEFFAGDIKDLLNEEFFGAHGKPDVVILDPPRAGMHQNVVDAIKYAAPQRIVYVSCNPSTQARDVGLLSDMYHLVKTRPVDMFPHTHHIENVALLVRK